ncbi:hypothetical protein pclt_cds_1196 [Pandoravirus celtis]|uniref:Uncharacterized protein n=1 Tax=Pandoravirus celtis TaxID=2568002 RepID=A0A4D6EKN6_9VIRU|nr:hypothetical protein pclt_cds_1196 [Pandoravirus celtis]
MKRVRSVDDAEPMLRDVDDIDVDQEDEEEGVDQTGLKRQRIDQIDAPDGGGAADASDIYNRNIQTLDERIERLQAGVANAEDMGEIMRLVAGHIESGTQAARRGGGFYPRLRKAYDGLWEALTWEAGAAAAVADAARAGRISGWPPTFADVQSVYAEMEPATADRHMAQIEAEAAVSLTGAGQTLGIALGQAVRRRAAAASLDPYAFSLVADAHILAQSLACMPANVYYVLRFYVNSQAWAMLVNLTPQPGHSPLVAAISVPDDAKRVQYRVHVAAPAFALSPALQPLIHQVGPFWRRWRARPLGKTRCRWTRSRPCSWTLCRPAWHRSML